MKLDHQGQLKDGQDMSPVGEHVALTYEILHCQRADAAYNVNHSSFRAPIQGPLCNVDWICTPTKSHFTHLKLNFTTGLVLSSLKYHSAYVTVLPTHSCCHDAIVNISFIAAVFNVPKKEKEGDTILSHSMEAYVLKKTSLLFRI